MKTKAVLRCGVLMAAVVLALTGLAGCNMPTPPFNVTGTYSGVYGLDDPQFALDDNCGITLELYHEPNIPFLQSTFAGVARLEWDCLLTPFFQTILGIESESAVLPLLATLKEDGTFSFDLELNVDDIPAALLDSIDQAGLDFDPTESFIAFAIHFSGTGVDTDDDGYMDTTDGSLSVYLQFLDDNGEEKTLDASGTYGVTRDEEAAK